ncbi:hypothetical protein HYFRA_00010195 [Hymenoscyphus fraxineus]|uniref:SET domain-containing protein n=1 Tax=Hymenoscyphus fraxineus TaxID=746836 RepID=A0A9N9KUQ6_9HELO|nr:hypothetical protein HYFRA_00010195 [Hymenoscyphus fraxineus]
MGIDAGFDMVPSLSKGATDRLSWGQFIDHIKEHYKDDNQVEIKPNYILFKAGEHPRLPFEGHKFLRFSSKVSGSIAADTNVGSYIETVTRIAQTHFGSRIRCWNEGGYEYGTYKWNEVNESLRSYEQPDDVETLTSIGQPLIRNDPIQEMGTALFELKHIPGNGRGLVARVDIPKGTRIIYEKPLFTAGPMPASELEGFLATKLKGLSKESQRQFLSLHNNFPGKNPFSGIFKTNALHCGFGSLISGIYPTICLINHSCMPNAHKSWNSVEGHETIHAVRSIKSGVEITISYFRGGTSSERQAELKEKFGFSCTCSGCTLSPYSLQASDNRRTRIRNLDKAVGDGVRMMNNPRESLKDCYSLIQLLEEEFDGCAQALTARTYYDAFQICIVHGDQARASVFAERAYKARVICEGEDSPNTQRAKSLVLKPELHNNFEAYSVIWKTTRIMLPQGLDTTEFEKWLFKLEN